MFLWYYSKTKTFYTTNKLETSRNNSTSSSELPKLSMVWYQSDPLTLLSRSLKDIWLIVKILLNVMENYNTLRLFFSFFSKFTSVWLLPVPRQKLSGRDLRNGKKINKQTSRDNIPWYVDVSNVFLFVRRYFRSSPKTILKKLISSTSFY